MQNHIILYIISKRKLDRSYSILYLSLQDCSTVTMVKTSNYDVNTKCAVRSFAVILLVSKDNAL